MTAKNNDIWSVKKRITNEGQLKTMTYECPWIKELQMKVSLNQGDTSCEKKNYKWLTVTKRIKIKNEGRLKTMTFNRWKRELQMKDSSKKWHSMREKRIKIEGLLKTMTHVPWKNDLKKWMSTKNNDIRSVK